MAKKTFEQLCEELRAKFQEIAERIKDVDSSQEERSELTKQAKGFEAAMNKFCRNKFKLKP